jgi:hypothetical protein
MTTDRAFAPARQAAGRKEAQVSTKGYLGLAAGFVLAFVAGWYAHARLEEISLRQVVLARSLERITYAAGALSFIGAEQPERLEKLLRRGLTEALEAAERQLADGTRLPHDYDFPSLLAGIDRACSAAELSGDAETSARLKALRSVIFGRPR